MSRPHGRAKYVVEKCRCDECRTAVREYERERRARTEPAYVGADRARQHVRWLSEQGVGLKQIVKVAGVSQGCLWKLMYGDEKRFGRPSKRIRRETEQAILSVLPDSAADGAWVDAAKTWEHLDVLLARGWSKVAIGRHVHGPDARTLQVGRDQVTRKTARIIEGLLDLPVERRLSKWGTPVTTPVGVVEQDDQALRDEARREQERIRRASYRADEPVGVVDADAQAVNLDLNPLPEGIDLGWRQQGTCRRPEYPTYLFFPARGDHRTLAMARDACARCPVTTECLDFALLTNADGVWAGTTEKQRRELRKERVAA